MHKLKIGSLHIDKRDILLHSLFWIGWILSFTLIQTVNEGPDIWLVWFVYYVITLPIFVTHTYLIAYWLLPRTFFKKRFILTAVGVFLLLIVFSVLELLISNYVVFGLMDKDRMFGPGYLGLSNIIISGIGNHYIILVFLAIKAGISWYSAENRKEELRMSKEETELELYRYQLQPQMVLSLIEDLETLTLKEQENTPDVIIKISNFLNRFLFEGKEEMITLELEVRLLQDFIEIHNSALGQRLSSNFVVSGNLKSFVVPPLLLLPVINNAIKMAYGCNNLFESTVIIKAEKKYLLFSFSFWSEHAFGLENNENTEITRKRLKYSFPGKHRLVENIDDNFRELSIEIFT